MKITVCSLFPELFETFFAVGLIGKAVESDLLRVSILNIRDFTKNKHLKTDDVPYGGGAGMVMTPQPLADCIEYAKANSDKKSRVIFMTPQGAPLSPSKSRELASVDENLIILCGRYEGIDERIREIYVDEEISIGDFVLNGGEIAAMALIEAVSRFVPGVMGNSESLSEESHENNLLEYPQYTRPADFRGHKVPDILLSGHHKNIRKWRLQQQLKRTRKIRPDLYEKYLSMQNEDGGNNE